MIAGLFPIDEKVSWEAHLSGFVIGLICAVIFRNYDKPQKQEEEDGNYDVRKLKVSYKSEDNTFMTDFSEKD